MPKIIYRVESPDGFGSNFFAVISAINYCLSLNFQPYIDVRNPSYLVETENCWDLLFEQPFKITDEEIYSIPLYSAWDLGDPLFGYHGDTRDKFIDKEFVSKQKKIIHDYVKPLDHIQNIVFDFWNNYKDKKVLGIHRRGRDHLTTGHAYGQNHLITDDYIESIINKYINDYDYLFLNSDEYGSYNHLKQIYGDKLIYFDDKKQYEKITSFSRPHTLANKDLTFINIESQEKIKLLQNLILEVILLSKCDKMLLMNSNVSHMSLFFSDHYNYEFYDNHVNYR